LDAEGAGAASAFSRVPGIVLAVLKNIFDFHLGSPSPGVPGEGPDCHLRKKIKGVGARPGPDPGGLYICYFHVGPKRSWVVIGALLAPGKTGEDRPERPPSFGRCWSVSKVFGSSPHLAGGCTLGVNFMCFKGRKSVILGVGAAPGAPETLPKGGGLRPPPF
jgi:hypothetical protein